MSVDVTYQVGIDEAPVAAKMMPAILLLRTVSMSVLATVVKETRTNRALVAAVSFISRELDSVEGDAFRAIYTLPIQDGPNAMWDDMRDNTRIRRHPRNHFASKGIWLSP